MLNARCSMPPPSGKFNPRGASWLRLAKKRLQGRLGRFLHFLLAATLGPVACEWSAVSGQWSQVLPARLIGRGRHGYRPPRRHRRRRWSTRIWDGPCISTRTSRENYGSKLDPSDTVDDFPGLSTVYLRVPWAFLEPEEGRFNWALFDTPAQRWIAKGKRVALRVTCSENWMPYATPEWVQEGRRQGYLL